MAPGLPDCAGVARRFIRMKLIHCHKTALQAHLESAAERHSRWFSWGRLPESMQSKAVQRLGMPSLFVAGAAATMLIVFGLSLIPERERFADLYNRKGVGLLSPLVVIALILLSRVIASLTRLESMEP